MLIKLDNYEDFDPRTGSKFVGSRVNKISFQFSRGKLTRKILFPKDVLFDAQITTQEMKGGEAGNPSRSFAATLSKSYVLVEESELTMNLRRCRASMDLLRSTSAERRKQTHEKEEEEEVEEKEREREERQKIGAKDKIRGFPVAWIRKMLVYYRVAEKARKTSKRGTSFCRRRAKSDLGRRKSAQDRPFRVLRHVQNVRGVSRMRELIFNPSDIKREMRETQLKFLPNFTYFFRANIYPFL